MNDPNSAIRCFRIWQTTWVSLPNQPLFILLSSLFSLKSLSYIVPIPIHFFVIWDFCVLKLVGFTFPIAFWIILHTLNSVLFLFLTHLPFCEFFQSILLCKQIDVDISEHVKLIQTYIQRGFGALGLDIYFEQISLSPEKAPWTLNPSFAIFSHSFAENHCRA